MLLEILRAFEGFTAEIALMRFQRHVNTNMGSNVIPLDSGSTTVAPLAGQVQVVGTLATNMSLANMVLQRSVPRLQKALRANT